MPTAQGTANGEKGIASRDTGCMEYVVRWSLVYNDHLLGKESDVTLMDESTQRYHLAMVEIDCPFFICYITLLLEILMGQNFRICLIFQLRQLLVRMQIRKKGLSNLRNYGMFNSVFHHQIISGSLIRLE